MKISSFSLALQRLSLLAVGVTLLASCQSSEPTDDEVLVEDDGEKRVTILGVMIGEQQEKIEEALKPFTAETGIEVVYEGTDAFATVLPLRVESGSAPDVAMFPQPGLMADFARQGELVPMSTVMDAAEMAEAYDDSWLNLGSVDGEVYGVWYRVSLKSLVWYSPKAFEAGSYFVPSTWEDMLILSDRLVADGKTPWCIGMESGDATGWVATDWVEDIMLRTASPETYDEWTTHSIPFNDPAVKNAVEKFGDIILNEDYVYGGTVGALSTPYGDSIKDVLGEEPQCYMNRQGNFITAFFPEDLNVDEDIAFFPLPAIEPEYGLPMLVAGDVFGMFNDTPEARLLMEYLTTEVPHEIAAGLGGFISPRKGIEPNAYPDELTRKQAGILSSAEVIRFDASDMMPGAVGTGTFWSGMVDYVGGMDVDLVLQEIENSWPEE
ncbi:MAG: ABC transporter substrate-binding protein [Limnothrix sp.]